MDPKSYLPAALACLLATLGGCASNPQPEPQPDSSVSVTFVDPGKFTDVGDTRMPFAKTRDSYLEDLRRHIVRTAARLLADKQTLAISITDVDMAGSFEPGPVRTTDIRIVKDIYPPRIELNFKLMGADSAVVKQGERLLRDSSFLMTATPSSYGAMRYEKEMVDRWLERELGASGK
jgi:Protein of unknown function (DUF3016)